MKNLLHLKTYLIRYRWKLVYGVFFILLTNIFAILAPRYIGSAVDRMGAEFTLGQVMGDIGLYILLAALSGIFLFLVRQNIIVTSRRIEYDLKNDYYSHLQTLSRSFFDTTSTGELISRGTNDLNAVRDFLGPGIMYSINTFFRLFFAILAMAAISPQLTILALLPAPLLSYAVYSIGKSIQKKTKSIQESYADITNLVQENISGIRVVKSYTREDPEAERFRKLNETYYHRNIALAKRQALFFAILTSLLALSLIPVIWVGGIKVVNGSMTIGGVTQFVIYVSMLSWPIISIGWVTNIIQKAASAQSRLNEILMTEPGITDPATPRKDTNTDIQPSLRFEHVSFSYPGSEGSPVLEDISFSIEPGSKVAVVGATGSGKSTLVNLIPRLYDPTAGRVLIGGRDIRTLPLSELRSLVGFVPQSNFLFSDTIASNIGYGDREGAMEAIIESSRIANLFDDVNDFPAGFETMLGEKGINLSGGQKQRTCIARALAWKPGILVLDDALSAVDTNTEAAIFQGLLEKLPGTTLLLISHRISTVKHCDRIIVIEDGRIAETGSHEELLARGKLYADLYNQQLLEDEISSLG